MPSGPRTGLLRRVASCLLRSITSRVLRRVASRRLRDVPPLGLPIAHRSLLHIASAAARRLGHVAACLLHCIAPRDLGRIAARDLRRVASCSPCDLRRVASSGLRDVGAWLHGRCDTELLEAEESRGRERWAETGERGARLIQRDAASAGLWGGRESLIHSMSQRDSDRSDEGSRSLTCASDTRFNAAPNWGLVSLAPPPLASSQIYGGPKLLLNVVAWLHGYSSANLTQTFLGEAASKKELDCLPSAYRSITILVCEPEKVGYQCRIELGQDSHPAIAKQMGWIAGEDEYTRMDDFLDTA